MNFWLVFMVYAAGIYLFQVSNGNNRTMSETFKVNSKDTRTTSGVFILNFEHILHIALM